MRYWYSLTVLHGMAILYGGYGHPQRLSDTFALRFGSFSNKFALRQLSEVLTANMKMVNASRYRDPYVGGAPSSWRYPGTVIYALGVRDKRPYVHFWWIRRQIPSRSTVFF
jgi:hypothetical protein